MKLQNISQDRMNQENINSVCIIGSGNLAFHLCVALIDKVDEVTIADPHTLEDYNARADCYIICVSDSTITSVAEKLPATNVSVVHTSGSTSIQVLTDKFPNCGVVYPLQTFTKGVDVDYDRLPIFIEASNTATYDMLSELAQRISSKVYQANSDKRRVIHLASVIACNFVNHLWSISDDLLHQENLSLDILYPLIDVTVAKMKKISPGKAQTGPAVRHDMNVINHHIDMLGDSAACDIYKMITDSIMN